MVALGFEKQARSLSLGFPLRAICFVGLAGFILLGPALPQVLGMHMMLVRPWIMYSGVGVGVLKGEFRLIAPGSQPRSLTPLQLLGRQSYPVQFHYEFDRRVFSAGDLGNFAAELCTTLAGGAVLSFDGSVGTRAGWQPLVVDDVCEESAETAAEGRQPFSAVPASSDA
jgi:hypothetical protein